MNAPQQEPILHPLDDEPQSQARANFAPKMLCGIVVFALALALSRVVPARTLFTIVAAPLFTASIYGTFYLRRVGEQLGYVLRSANDLQTARQAINFNMKLAFVFGVLMYPLLGMVLMRREWICAVALALFTVPFGAWSTSVEEKIKEITSDDNNLEEAFHDSLSRWKEPSFGLKSDL